ncbi:hypothetical protein DFQ28_009608 [Apophysomyces sp. BC1034]|nr:hypothetical protein DFQ30_006548 [Apophysomyces sp. BC1015]KAG0181046.1 hypothetical protein DFQ29_009513 [Apophysomyces sp. BC1021]KAG0192287.1 hypothetical protein DFQ28_009608 [Apophysomyces sp. BC1034]
MTRSKETTWAGKHERHVSRNGQTDIRCPVKKSGAGFANWGLPGGELADMEDVATQQAASDPVAKKLQLVDHKTFEDLRQSDQRVGITA